MYGGGITRLVGVCASQGVGVDISLAYFCVDSACVSHTPTLTPLLMQYTCTCLCKIFPLIYGHCSVRLCVLFSGNPLGLAVAMLVSPHIATTTEGLKTLVGEGLIYSVSLILACDICIAASVKGF